MTDRNFYLSSIPEIKIIEEYDFNNRGIAGYAEVIGCKIAFFRKNKSGLLDAFSFIEIKPQEFDFCNYILEKIDFPVKFGDSFGKIRDIFGKEKSTDNFFENYVRYNYSVKNCFVSFCIENNRVIGTEVVFSPEIISGLEEVSI